MAQLLPPGTLRRWVFEFLIDRPLGWIRSGQYRPLSNLCGDEILDSEETGVPVTGFCCRLCAWLDKLEPGHCRKNGRKP